MSFVLFVLILALSRSERVSMCLGCLPFVFCCWVFFTVVNCRLNTRLRPLLLNFKNKSFYAQSAVPFSTFVQKHDLVLSYKLQGPPSISLNRKTWASLKLLGFKSHLSVLQLQWIQPSWSVLSDLGCLFRIRCVQNEPSAVLWAVCRLIPSRVWAECSECVVVGMVCFALAKRASEGIVTLPFTRHFEGDRAEVRLQSCYFIIDQLIKVLEPLRLD